MLTELCQYLKNWFVVRDRDKHYGKFTISGGKIAPLFNLQEGQYFRIIGSVFNDGVHKSDEDLVDENEFEGAIWLMSVPPSVIELNDEIVAWMEKNDDIVNSPYQSESFGGYSYTKASGSSSSGLIGWQSQFADRLNRWRKI